MTVLLTILVVLFALGALAALIRGIIAFLRTTEEELNNPNPGPSASGLKQNKMMWRRIQLQALAIIAAVLLLVLAHPHAS
jgi:Sec-independent protein translocase protein TatA